MMGQAVVTRSETRSWACDEGGKRITDSWEHGYAYYVTKVGYTL